MAKIYHEQDCNLQVLDRKKVAIIGYGSQVMLMHLICMKAE